MRVLLVDDHEVFRLGVSHLLDRESDLHVVGQAGNGSEAVALAAACQPDLVLMDINMPAMSGVEATRQIKARYPQVRVVILTVSDLDRDLFEAIKAGADGYLLKSAPAADLLGAVRSAGDGETPLSPIVAARLLKEFRRVRPELPAAPAPQRLSPREIEVLQLATRGLTYKEIAGQLYVAESTVKNHMRNIMEKLHLRNRSEAVRYALTQKLSEPNPAE